MAGLSGIVVGLLLLSVQGVHASYFPGLFFAFLFMGLGAGASFLPLLTMGMAEAPPQDAGLASGIMNVSVQLFGAIGLAVLGTVATDHYKSLTREGRLADQRPHRRLSPRVSGRCGVRRGGRARRDARAPSAYAARCRRRRIRNLRGRALWRSRSAARLTLPLGVFGSSAAKSMMRGYL